MRMTLLALAVALLIGPACGGDSPERIVGGNGEFEAASLSIAQGMVQPIDGGTCNPAHVNTITITAQPPVAAWSGCLPLFSTAPPGQGSRPISDTELGSVGEALRQVRIGQSGFCKKDGEVITLDTQAHGLIGRYIDLPSACGAPGPGPEGRTYVTGLRHVAYAMGRLSQ